MLYLKKILHGWFLTYSAEKNITIYKLWSKILLDWAKAHGFKCPHKFEEKNSPKRLTYGVNPDETHKCLLCNEKVPVWPKVEQEQRVAMVDDNWGELDPDERENNKSLNRIKH